MKNNETPDFCAGCGNCCNGVPGGWLPDQLDDAKVESLLAEHKAVWDWWASSDGDIKYLRPATIPESRDKRRTAAWSVSGGCIFLGFRGCRLSFEERPWECKNLVATAPKTCHQQEENLIDLPEEEETFFTRGKSSKYHVAMAWKDSGRN